MGRLFKAIKAGVRGAVSATGPGRFRAAGLPISCQHCRADIFEKREAQLNSAGMTLLDLDWMNRSGTALICTNCGLIQWFGRTSQRTEE